LNEKLKFSALWSLDKFDDPSDSISKLLKDGASVEEIKSRFPSAFAGHIDMGENLMLDAGITVLLNLLIGATGQTNFANGNSRLTVGTSTTAAAATNTTLGAFAFSQGCDSGFPSVSGQVVTFRVTVASANGNVSWQEFGADNDGAAGTAYSTTAPTYSSTIVLLNHLISNQGTKTSGQTWVLTLTITES
jgi:hypothetical protein